MIGVCLLVYAMLNLFLCLELGMQTSQVQLCRNCLEFKLDKIDKKIEFKKKKDWGIIYVIIF